MWRLPVNLRMPFIVLMFLSLSALGQPAQDSPVFKRIFGISRMLPADIVEHVKALKPGEKLKRVTNNDGKIDELWYIDTAKRHTISPMLVCVVDEDGDMEKMQRGDLDSDLYILTTMAMAISTVWAFFTTKTGRTKRKV
jgi:hypothetical protein